MANDDPKPFAISSYEGFLNKRNLLPDLLCLRCQFHAMKDSSIVKFPISHRKSQKDESKIIWTSCAMFVARRNTKLMWIGMVIIWLISCNMCERSGNERNFAAFAKPKLRLPHCAMTRKYFRDWQKSDAIFFRTSWCGSFQWKLICLSKALVRYLNVIICCS